jgi:hypothetical protein
MSGSERDRASFGVEVISKVERTAVRCSLHRLVRLHFESSTSRNRISTEERSAITPRM